MNQTRHMVMKACEEIMEAGGRANGIDKALLRNLASVCEEEVSRQNVQERVGPIMSEFDRLFNRVFGERSPF